LFDKTSIAGLSKIDIRKFGTEKMLIIKVITAKAAVSIKIIL